MGSKQRRQDARQKRTEAKERKQKIMRKNDRWEDKKRLQAGNQNGRRIGRLTSRLEGEVVEVSKKRLTYDSKSYSYVFVSEDVILVSNSEGISREQTFNISWTEFPDMLQRYLESSPPVRRFGLYGGLY